LDVATVSASGRPPLVGRERELRLLRDRLDDGFAGHDGVILLAGEAGVGKTALARALCDEAAGRGAPVLTGRCYDLGDTPPYGPWVELFGRLPRADLPTPPAAFADRAGVGAVQSQAELTAGVRAFFVAAAIRQPLMLLLDDLHWADAASLDLLRFLARDLVELPLVLVATYRNDELDRDHPLARLLPLLEQESETTRLTVRPLSSEAIQEFVGARYALPETDANRLAYELHRRSGGNAFFVVQLLRAFEDEEVLTPAESGWRLGSLDGAKVPPLLRHVIDARLGRLDAEARRALELAAVIGQEVPIALWTAALDRDEEAAQPIAEAAMRARLLDPGADGSQLEFVHALAREAIYEGILPFRRRALHRRVATVLLGRPAPDPDAVATHLVRADAAAAADWLVRAGERAERACAALTAAERYGAAAAFLDERGEDPGRRGWLHLGAAFLRRFQNPRRAMEHLAAAADAAEWARDSRLAALVGLVRGRAYLLQNMPVEALRETQAGLAAIEALAPPPDGDDPIARREESIRLAANDGFVVFELAQAGRLAEAGRLGREAAAVQPEETRSEVSRTAFASYGLAIASALRGEPAVARQAFARAASGCAVLDHAYDHRVARALALRDELSLLALPYHADDRGYLAAVAARAEQGASRLLVEGADAAGGGAARQPLLPLLALEGHWQEVQRIAALPDDHHLLGFGWFGLSVLGPIARAQGNRESAWQMVRRAWPAGPATEFGSRTVPYAIALQCLAAALALDEDDPSTAAAWLEMHDRWLDWTGVVLGRAEGETVHARYLRAAGDIPAALSCAVRALALAGEPRQPLALLASHRLAGELAIELGRHDIAEKHLAGSLALADACRSPYERALTLLPLAALRAEIGQVEAARQLLAEARAVCEALGAVAALVRADALAGRLGGEGQVAPAGARARLTRREAQVLALVAEGASNREIAEALFLSPRTVERHITNLYGKIGVEHRAEAVAYALRHGLTRVD
jgi:DNA-binding CsgD family transcriptional regulator